jgi:ABC-2 type transport system permease protein
VTAVIRSEVLKLVTVRTFLWIGLANVGLVLLTALVSASTASLETADDHRSAAQIAGTALVLALIAGIVVMGGEATHGTITQTLLVTPVRERVLLAKVAVAALIGLTLALTAEVLVLLLLVPGASLDFHEARLVLLGILIGAPLAGALGVGFAAVMHAQGAAIGISLAWLLIGESLTPAISEAATKYTPGRTFGALASGDTAGDGVLGMAGGGVVAAVWAAVFVGAGALALLGRDV